MPYATSNFGPYGLSGEPNIDTTLYRTESLGNLAVSRNYDALRGAESFTFHHVALDLHVQKLVTRTAVDRMCGVSAVDIFGREAELKMLQMLRDRINPPPQPAPKSMYAIQHSSASEASYLGAAYSGSSVSWSWRVELESALLFPTQAAAITRLSECVARHGVAFAGTVQVVRIDYKPLTGTECVVTVL